MMKSKRYSIVLWLLLCLFCLRVFAQLIQYFAAFEFLPAFENWYSGALDYPYLLASQLFIIGIYFYICVRFSNGNIKSSKSAGIILFALGMIYVITMMVRLIIGQFFTSSDWFRAYIPIFFHFILAFFLLVVGWYHLTSSIRNHGHHS